MLHYRLIIFLSLFQASGLSQIVDARIISKIHSLVEEGVRNVKEMERHISIFVKNDLFRGRLPPAKGNSAFNPKRNDISNHMYKATVKHRYAKIDQENLFHKVKEWKNEHPEDNFFYREYGDADKENLCYDENSTLLKRLKYGKGKKLLFVHQTQEQRRLLNLYGQDICLLDATYKTTKYSIPLFFVVTKTNVDYQIVGSFATQDETTSTITEALQILKSWISNWTPKVFFVDNCEEEIQSLESVFPGIPKI